MQGGTRIDEYNKNDVYLEKGSGILVEKALTTAGTVARITPEKYSESPAVQVLYGNAVGSQHGKFIVTPKGSQQWKVDSYGLLRPK